MLAPDPGAHADVRQGHRSACSITNNVVIEPGFMRIERVIDQA